MASHSSILAWEIPWTEEPGGLQSMGSQKSWVQLSDYTTAAGPCMYEFTLFPVENNINKLGKASKLLNLPITVAGL